MGNMTTSDMRRSVFALCWCAYAGGYLCRTNLPIALPGISQFFGWNMAKIGLISTAFFWSYAIGQLVNGYIGDRVQARPFVFIGLVTAATSNLIMSFSQSLSVMTIVWAINGVALSTLWGPIVRTLSLWFSKEEWTKIAVGISTSMIGGYLLAWGIIGEVIARSSWQWAFRIPALALYCFSLIWMGLMRSDPPEDKVGEVDGHNAKVPFYTAIPPRLWLVALACMAQGMLKDGIALWGPMLLKSVSDLDQGGLAKVSLFIPAIGLFGILLSGWLNKVLGNRENLAAGILMAAALLCCVGLFAVWDDVILCSVFLGITTALLYGANTLLLTIVPRSYSAGGQVSTIAGFLDFSSYVGAAMAGILTGLIIDRFGWQWVLLSWSVFGAIGVCSIFAVHSLRREKIDETTETGTSVL